MADTDRMNVIVLTVSVAGENEAVSETAVVENNVVVGSPL